GQVGLAFATAGPRDGATATPTRTFRELGQGIIAGLAEMGIQAHFRPKNDLEVGGRKIAGLGMCTGPRGGLLFHCSLLVDLDLSLMLDLLNIPREKLSDKLIAHIGERMTTVSRELGRAATVAEVRPAVARGFRSVFGVDLVERPFSAEELAAVRALDRDRYQSEEWIFQGGSATAADKRERLRSRLIGPCLGPRAEGTGTSVVKTGAGLIRVYVALAGETLKSVLITGDFFSTAEAVAGLEARLKWSPLDRDRIIAAIEAERAQGRGIPDLPAEHLAGAICRAAGSARARRAA
ncbi:MAG: lipoate--protein ligase family protein, partial [Chloroflexota bacterium]